MAEAVRNVPLFELLSDIPDDNIVTPVDRAALMNTIYQHHPEHTVAYIAAEQVGLLNCLGLFLRAFDVPTELICDKDLVISTQQAG